MTTPPLTPQVIKRLTFIRLLYQHGVEQSRLASPLSFTSLLSFHDSVEHFFVLISDHRGGLISDRDTRFMDYFDKLGKIPDGVKLMGRTAMRRLNDHRNSFKHAGNLPVPDTIEQTRAEVTTFFEDNTPLAFGIPFSGIDMADLIPQPEARGKVKAASAAFSSGDHLEGMTLLAKAFTGIFNEHLDVRSYNPSPYSFGRNVDGGNDHKANQVANMLATLDGSQRYRTPTRRAETFGKEFSVLATAVSQMQGAMRVMAIGVDYHKYHRFQQLTPRVRTWGPEERIEAPEGYAPNQEEFDYCRQFVITVAMRLADVEAHAQPPSWDTPEK